LEYDSWVFEAVGELLALAPTLSTPISRKTLRESLETHLSSFRAETFTKSIIALESSLNLTRSFVQKLINEERIPYLYNFLKMCYALHTTPAKFYLGSDKDIFNKLSSILERLPVSPRVNGHKKGSHLTTEDIDYIRMVLVTIVDSINEPPFPSLRKIAKLTGYSTDNLVSQCSELSKTIVIRSANKPLNEDNIIRMMKALENALNATYPISLRTISKQIGCSEQTLKKYFPMLCDAIISRYLGRFNEAEIERRLQDALKSEDLALSLSEIARQLGTTRDLIKRRYPELCKNITNRRDSEQKKIRENLLVENALEIRQAVIMYHSQGIYPSSKRVSSYLEDDFILFQPENRKVWKTTMRDLGYFAQNE